MHPDRQITHHLKAAALALLDRTATPCLAVSEGDIADIKHQTRCGGEALQELRRCAVAKRADRAQRINDPNRKIRLSKVGRLSSTPAICFKKAAAQPDLRADAQPSTSRMSAHLA